MGLIKAKLTAEDDNVFCDVIHDCTDDITEYFDQWADELSECLHEVIFAQAEEQFRDDRLAEDQPLSPEEDRARSSVLEVVGEARTELVKLQNDVAELKARCDSKTAKAQV